MSLVARGLGISPKYLVDTSIWGFTVKPVAPPPVVTTAVDPFAKKHANTQVIRESHLKKWLGKDKKRKLRPKELAELRELIIAAPAIEPLTFGPSDARYLERAVKLITRMAVEDFTLGVDEMKLLEGTPEVLKKIH